MKWTKRFFIATIMVGVLLSFMNLQAAAKSKVARKDGEVNGVKVWLTQDTQAKYKNGQTITLSKGKKYKAVRELSDGRLAIQKGKNTLYIDSTYVLINVKKFIPSIEVDLDLASSDNLFNMGGEDIPGVSDKQYYTTSGSEKGSACWLRYEVAKRLCKAQAAFKKDGYSIVIYDAYRPYSVTCSIRDNFSNFLSQKPWSFRSWFGELGESWFLAQGVSSHNYGRAVDMSLRDTKTKKLLNMPSTMHTLDKRAAYDYWAYSNSKKAKNALYLKKVMESVGFTYLKSEWWHFQVNDIDFGPVIDLAI